MNPEIRHILHLAPLQGYTEVEFRRAWTLVYSGFSEALSPFIPLAEGSRFRERHIRDVLPAENKRLAIIPQVLGNDPKKFINLALRLQELGYETLNWNLGCPKRTVARKKRGAGILPYPDLLRETLEQIIPLLPVKLSIKTRLGYHDPEEFYDLIKVYNDFPLESLIIHPRTGLQQYEGEMYLDFLDDVISEINQKIVFSGDIHDMASFEKLSVRYPQISNWMIGRGILTNPALAEIIQGKDGADDPEVMRNRQGYLHQELYCEIRSKLGRSRPILNKMKDYWSYFSRWFIDSENIFTLLARMHDLEEFMNQVKRILNEQPLAPVEGRPNRQIKIGK